jgi:hypothetical protein
MKMEFSQLFQQRHDVLYDFFLADFWKTVPDNLMRQRPHPNVNSIAWILWHLTRVEDSGMNRFVTDRSQILDEGNWMERMNIPWRHNGGGMSFVEVDDLNQRINLAALHDYSIDVQTRSQEIIKQINLEDLDVTLQPEHLKIILLEEGLAHSNGEELVKWYSGWSKGKCLMTFGLTHPFQHIGEMGVIASLLGIVFD